MLITMKKLCILFALTVTLGSCLAQSDLSALKNVSYYTVASAHWIAEWSVKGDSLLMVKHRDSSLKDVEHLRIEYVKTRGDYIIIAVKEDRGKIIAGSKTGILYTGFMIISFSKDKHKLFLMQLGFPYKSIKEAQKGMDTIRLDNKYFTTWYNKSELDKYLQYPKIQDAPEDMVHKVMDDMFAEMTINREKILNTRSVPFQNWLNVALIKNNLSPMITAAEFQQALDKYHIKLPQIPLSRQVIPKVKPNNQPGIRIDEPIKK
jgi:hypothetical protein